jgi:phage tail protein X
MKTYTTVQGDMWDMIAYKQLGSTSYTDRLMTLNSKYIDTYIFPAGVVLTLPDIQADEPTSLPPWKKVSG